MICIGISSNGRTIVKKDALIWNTKKDIEAEHTVYSDRLYQWDSKKYNECCEKVWHNHGQYFDSRKPDEIERFLSLYYDRDITLVSIYEYENASNGFPYWRFDYI